MEFGSPSADDGPMSDSAPPVIHPSENIVQIYADAWLAADYDAAFALYADDIVLHYGGTSDFAGDHVGKEQAIQTLVETSIRSQRRLVAVDLLLTHGDVGALFVRESLTTRDGDAVEVARALRFAVDDGRISECWLYDQNQHVVDQAWRAAPTNDEVSR